MYVPEKDEEFETDEELEFEEEAGEAGGDDDEDGAYGDEDGEDDEEEGGDDAPEDLAAAFKRVQGMDDGGAEEAMGDDGEDGEGDPDDGEGEEDDPEYGDDDLDRGPSTEFGEVDYAAVKRTLIKDLNARAMAKAAGEFRDAGIREFQMKDIYERTKDGRVVYHNPDDPNRPFSSRMEAQSWIDSFNGQIKSELRRRAVEIRDEEAGTVIPSLRLMDFAPAYDSMDEATRGVFDDLIEGHEVLDSRGKVVGYDCDLGKMAAKAERMAARFSGGSDPAPRRRAAKKPAASDRRPSVDMRSHGSGGSGKMKREPQTLEEAMMRLRQQSK